MTQAPPTSSCPICWWQSQRSCSPCPTLCSRTRLSARSPLCATSLTASWSWSSAGPNTSPVRRAQTIKSLLATNDLENLLCLNRSQGAGSVSLRAKTRVVINMKADRGLGSHSSLSKCHGKWCKISQKSCKMAKKSWRTFRFRLVEQLKESFHKHWKAVSLKRSWIYVTVLKNQWDKNCLHLQKAPACIYTWHR